MVIMKSVENLSTIICRGIIIMSETGNEVYYDNGSVRDSTMSDAVLNDPERNKWLQRPIVTKSFQRLTPTEESLQAVCLVNLRNIEKVSPFTEQEKSNGIKIAVPIVQIAEMMGYDLEQEKINKGYYRQIKSAAESLVTKKSITTDFTNPDGSKGFVTYNIFESISYNENNCGKVVFSFTPSASHYLFAEENSGESFTLYSLICKNKLDDIGRVGTTRLHEILKADFYRAQMSPKKYIEVEYDYIDLRCMMGFIKSDEPAVERLLREYNNKNLKNEKVAYERLLAIEDLDTPIRNELKRYTASDEYKNVDKSDKEALKQRKLKYQSYSDRIVCQYNNFHDFEKRVLVPAQKTLIECIRDYPELVEFTFEYRAKKYRNKFISVVFTIYTVDAYLAKEKECGVQLSLLDYLKERDEALAESKTEEIKKMERVGDAGKTTAEEIKELSSSKRGRKKKPVDSLEIYANLRQYVKNNPYVPSNGYPGLTDEDLIKLARQYNYDEIIKNYEILRNSNNVRNPFTWLCKACNEGNYTMPPAKETVEKPAQNIESSAQIKDWDAMEDYLLNRDKYTSEERKNIMNNITD